MLPEFKEVVILGAGPAGLSLAYELKRRDIDYVVLEKGKAAGESFSQYPKNIWFGPWLNNTLPGSKVAWNWLLRRATQPAYTWYLREYARRHELNLCPETLVHQVGKASQGFVVDTSRGPIAARFVVNATGYFSRPYIPDVPGLDQTHIPFLHSSQYREAADALRVLGERPPLVLVVGQGLSAGETMCELHRAGMQVSLSIRGPLVIGPSPTLEALLSPINYLWERLAIRLNWRYNSNPPMAGGESQHLIDDGWVDVMPEIERFESERVVFRDGRARFFGLVVFCTGYRYAMDHLSQLLSAGDPTTNEELESKEAPGLFFLGLDQLRTYRSRFLRGIRADARYLASVLSRRVLGRDEPPPLRGDLVDLDQTERLEPSVMT